MSAQKLQTIVDEISNLSVLQLAEITKMLEEKFGVSAAMPMMSAAPSAGAAAGQEAKKEEEKTEYKVELLEAPDKIKAIKAIRTVKKDLGLTEAKQLVESAPCVIADAASKDDAKAMKEALEAAGAKVKLS